MSHSDTVTELPPGFEVLASTPRCAKAAFVDASRRVYGLQFHPEVDHSRYGRQILSNFVFDICKATPAKQPKDTVNRLKREISARVKNDRVFFLVSGGVDSTVAFSLVGDALRNPERVLGLYIDTGLMRKNETAELKSNLELRGLRERVLVHDESTRFLSALREQYKPEDKRQAIGREFVAAQADAMESLGIDPDQWLLGQGTIYPDTIESGGSNGKAALIKTHHNRCAEIQALIERKRVVEPLAEFYKDEVRNVGRSIGLSDSLIDRWPFPGPGLAIRTLCKPKGPVERSKPVSLPDALRMDEIVSFPLQSVGVQGDARTYKDVVALRGHFDYDHMQEISSYVCNVLHEYNRVIYQLGSVSNSRLEEGVVIPERYVTRDRLDVLREADHIARTVLEEKNMTGSVWQFPVVLAPLSFGRAESVILRPVNSENGMTANFARLPEMVIREISSRILETGLVDSVFLDVTDKPPATIEWE
jgi:GMP synthase (glutamine-hydrolysing)